MARDFKFRKKRDCTIRVAKTKTLISFTVTAKLIWVFVFVYTNIQFSHVAAHIMGAPMAQLIVDLIFTWGYCCVLEQDTHPNGPFAYHWLNTEITEKLMPNKEVKKQQKLS